MGNSFKEVINSAEEVGADIHEAFYMILLSWFGSLLKKMIVLIDN